MITSSNYKRDWYGHIVNQCGHNCAGLVASVVMSYAGMSVVTSMTIVLVAYIVVIEFTLQPESRPGEIMMFDGFEDTIHFGIGAGLYWAILAGGHNALILVACWGVIIGVGAWLRR